MKLRPFKKDGGGYGNLDMANQHESDKETPIRHGRQGKDEKGETYIGLPARNGKKMTLNKIQHTKVGDDIHFFVNGQENRGVVVKMGGTYVSVFKEDGNIHEIPINETFFVKDILVNKTWDDMSGEERAELLQNAHAYSPRFIAKNWDELPRELKTVLSDKATGMEQNHDKDNLEKEEANHAVTGYAQTQQNTLGKVAPAVGAAVGAAVGRAVGGYAGKKLAEHGEKKKDSITGEQSIGGRPHEEGQSHGAQSTSARITEDNKFLRDPRHPEGDIDTRGARFAPRGHSKQPAGEKPRKNEQNFSFMNPRSQGSHETVYGKEPESDKVPKGGRAPTGQKPLVSREEFDAEVKRLGDVELVMDKWDVKKAWQTWLEQKSHDNPARNRGRVRPKKDVMDVEKDSMNSRGNENVPQGRYDNQRQSHARQSEHERLSNMGLVNRDPRRYNDPEGKYDITVDLDEESKRDLPNTGQPPKGTGAKPEKGTKYRKIMSPTDEYETPMKNRDRNTGAAQDIKRKGLDGTLKALLELKSDVEEGRYGNAGSTAEVGVSTDTPLDVSEASGYEERPHLSLEDVGKLPRSNSKPHHSNEVKESNNKEVLEPKYIKSKEKSGEGGQTGAINTSEGGAFNPVYNAYDTPITPEETKTGRKIAGRDQVKKGVPVYNVNSWGIKYVTKENDWADDAHANDSDIERHKKLRPDLNFRQTGKPCAHCGKQGFEIEVQNPAHENKDWFSLAGTSHADRNNIVCPTCDAKQTRSRAGGVTGKPPKGGE